MKFQCAAVLLVLLVTSCAPVRVARYDHVQRVPSTSVQAYVLGDPIPPHRVIALLSKEAKSGQEATAIGAMVERAQQLGAEGVIHLPATLGESNYQWSQLGGGHKREPNTYRLQAIIFTNGSPTPTASKPASPDLTR